MSEQWQNSDEGRIARVVREVIVSVSELAVGSHDRALNRLMANELSDLEFAHRSLERTISRIRAANPVNALIAAE